jgi:hypothetical protein
MMRFGVQSYAVFRKAFKGRCFIIVLLLPRRIHENYCALQNVHYVYGEPIQNAVIRPRMDNR